MGALPQDSTNFVVLVTGADTSNFGTAFAIHRDEQSTYFLTCKHVVDDVGGHEGLQVGQKPATLIASDHREGLDIAVLQVSGQFEIPLLELSLHNPSRIGFHTAGFYDHGKSELAQSLRGRLGERVEVSSRSLNCRCPGWYLELEQGQQLRRGYSGAPLLDELGKAIGFVSYKQDKGSRGLAFSIEALRHVWQEMPQELTLIFNRKRPQLETSRTNRLPLMNLNNERALFERIASGEDSDTRLIVVNGKSGLGKTRFLEECKAIASSYQLPMHVIALGQQTSVEQCLDQIVFKLGTQLFLRYEQLLTQIGTGSPADREKSLARAFFADLSNLSEMQHLILFLDQYEKSHPEFKKWFTQVFAPLLSAQPFSRLIVVAAGQEPISADEAWSGYYPIHLQGLSVEHFHKFVQDCNVTDFPPAEIEKFHEYVHGEPKFFVDYITARLKGQGLL